MDNNFPCQKWLTTNQDEYRDPSCTKVFRGIQSEELARYEDCIKKGRRDEESLKNEIRTVLCCTEQNENREPVIIPTDSHIASTKPKWCRCLATGDPNCYEEVQEELQTDSDCYCKMVYNQMDTPDSKGDSNQSTHFIDFRDPAFPYIAQKIGFKEELDSRKSAYKQMADRKDEAKQPKIVLPSPSHPNYNYLKESDDCRKGIVKKYIWTSTYREMNKDGAALPLAVREIPKTCLERPPGDPMKKSNLAPKSICNLGEVFEKWDRPQVRLVANRCDLMSVNNDLCKDSYFQHHRLCRTRFARCPEGHEQPSAENLKLAKTNQLRLPYDKMIPGYGGYDMMEAPPVCKIKQAVDPNDPYELISTYQTDYTGPHPKEVYENPVQPYTPAVFEKMGIKMNPLSTLSQEPLPCVHRLSSYLN